MIKRQRGRGRNPNQKPQNNNPNRAYESNGPDLKVRGSAQTVFEKYQQLGRDAQSNGDRVLGENYMQHAEHYFRVLRAMQPSFVPRSELMIAGYEDEYEEGEEGGQPAEAREGEPSDNGGAGAQPDFEQGRNANQNRDQNRNNRDRDGRDRDNRDRGQRDFRDNRDNREPRPPRDPNEPRAEGEEGQYGRRRRRDRYGNEGGNGPQNGEGGSEYRGDNNRFEGRRDGRPNYRDENRGDGQNIAPVAVQAEGFEQPEFVQPASFSDPQEIIVQSEAPAPARERRPRPPRPPRAPRSEDVSAPETGFGDEMPAFLTAPVPVVSSE